jgi:pimeloyl-ACP methyl ester carboxylesterase
MIVYIHGASATAESFNFIREHIKDKNIAIEYDSAHGFEENLNEMKEVIQKYKNIIFLCHSLGGIYALHLADAFPDRVKGAITLSTPYGGAEVADYAKYFLPFSRLLKDIGPSSWPMKQLRQIKIKHPWVNIVSTAGKSPWMNVPNDGIVTIASMKRYEKDMDIIEVNVNHYEIVISHNVLDIIKQRLEKLK